MGTSHCLNCSKVLFDQPRYLKGEDGGRYFDGLDIAPDYCSTRCARDHARQELQHDYDNRDQMSIFEVERV